MAFYCALRMETKERERDSKRGTLEFAFTRSFVCLCADWCARGFQNF